MITTFRRDYEPPALGFGQHADGHGGMENEDQLWSAAHTRVLSMRSDYDEHLPVGFFRDGDGTGNSVDYSNTLRTSNDPFELLQHMTP